MDTTELTLLRSMTTEQRQMYSMEMDKARKSASTTLLLNFLGLHRFYLEDVVTGLLQWSLCLFFVGWFWILFDLFRSKDLTAKFNNKKAVEVATTVKMLYPSNL